MNAADKRVGACTTQDGERGGSIVIDVPNGAQVTEAAEAEGHPCYRPNAGIRVAPHFWC
jgi:GTPase involved in cell partitioning and DNA repair